MEWTPGHNTDAAGALALTLSNLAFVPATLLLIYLGEYATATFFFQVLVVSALYHTCDAHLFCFISLPHHRLADYIFVWRALIWSLTYLGTDMRTAQGRHFHLISYSFWSGIAFFIILSGHTTHWLVLIAAIGPLAVAAWLAFVGERSLFTRTPWAIATALLGVVALVFFVFTEETYVWTHSLWHVAAGCAMFTFVVSIWPFVYETKPRDSLQKSTFAQTIARKSGRQSKRRTSPPIPDQTKSSALSWSSSNTQDDEAQAVALQRWRQSPLVRSETVRRARAFAAQKQQQGSTLRHPRPMPNSESK